MNRHETGTVRHTFVRLGPVPSLTPTHPGGARENKKNGGGTCRFSRLAAGGART
jgi:hypothetical protein